MLTGAGRRVEALQSRERATGQRQLCRAPHAPHQRVRLQDTRAGLGCSTVAGQTGARRPSV